MENENETDMNQVLEDGIFSDPMCLVELVGWVLFVVSLVIGLVVLKYDVAIDHIGWGFFAGGLCLAFWGSYKQDKSSKCSVIGKSRT